MPLIDSLVVVKMRRIDALAALSETAGMLTRRYLTPEHSRANTLVGAWMKCAGMTTHQDAVGNIVGRYEGANKDAPALVIGSHLDTVINAGQFDGMLGVLCNLAVAAVDRMFCPIGISSIKSKQPLAIAAAVVAILLQHVELPADVKPEIAKCWKATQLGC